MTGIKKIIDKRMDSERERARREAKRYERLESLGLRRLGSNSKRKGETLQNKK